MKFWVISVMTSPTIVRGLRCQKVTDFVCEISRERNRRYKLSFPKTPGGSLMTALFPVPFNSGAMTSSLRSGETLRICKTVERNQNLIDNRPLRKPETLTRHLALKWSHFEIEKSLEQMSPLAFHCVRRENEITSHSFPHPHPPTGNVGIKVSLPQTGMTVELTNSLWAFTHKYFPASRYYKMYS